MVFLKFLGAADLLCAAALIFSNYVSVPWNILLLFSIYLIVKGFVFRGDFNSWIDIGSGIYFIFVIFGLKSFLALIIAVYLAQKGLRSLI